MKQEAGFLSKRGQKALEPPLSYFTAFFEAQKDVWSSTNPGGHVVLAIAENRLSGDMLEEYMASLGPFPSNVMHYQDARGTDELRGAVALLLQTTFMRGLSLDPAHISVLAGAGSVLDMLFHCVCGPGDAVLIPAPYYPAFDNDLSVRNQVVPIPVHLDLDQPLWRQLDAAVEAATLQDQRVRALLFTHPTNPQGTCYAPQQLKEMLSWCLHRRMHCISDEIYANSVFGEGAQFTSALQVLQEEGPGMRGFEFANDLVHIAFGLSKDFCASGLRVGCLWSRNALLNDALGNLGYICSCSAHTQWMITKLLRDQAFVSRFLAENHKRLRHSYTTLTSALDGAGISYTPADAAMFLWVDCRSALVDVTSWEEEAELWLTMAKDFKVLLTPGSACHGQVPGFFRMCWAWMPVDSLPVAVQRMVNAMKQHKATK